ncbi:MAG: hypothetical protein AAGU77_09720 [Bacillota bacterium]
MYRILGYLNAALFVLITSPYWLRRVNQWALHIRSAGFMKLLKLLRAMHKPLAALLLISAAVHGYLALGSLRPHTGSLVFLVLLVTGSLGLASYKKKKPSLFKWHKGMALVVAALIALHILAPGALYYIFG